MPAIPLGKISSAAVPTPVITEMDPNHPTLRKRIATHGIMFEVWPTNTGLIYIGLSNMDKTTGVGVLAILGLPSFDSNGKVVFLPTFSMALTINPNGLNAADFFIDADVSGDAVLVTALQA